MPASVALGEFTFSLFWSVYEDPDLNVIKFNRCPGIPKFKETAGPVLS